MTNAFEALDVSILVDQLAEFTSKYTQLITAGGFQPDVEVCKEMMEELQAEIMKRKMDRSN